MQTFLCKMDRKIIFKETLSLLYWTMLAACTVGPGTVVTCARAGAEFQLNLIWALIFASILAYILLEGTARLTITSGKSLGECLQVKYQHGRLIWGVGVMCWVVTLSVFIGNTLYECNNWAGGIAAVYAIPGVTQSHGVRIGCCIVYAVIVFLLLYMDKVDALGVGLGVVMIGMVILFVVVVSKLGVDAKRFFKGLLPISMPSGSANIVLSLVGTTAIGFNLFLGGKMAEGKKLVEAQRGIGFSTLMALIVSVLVLIVGDGVHNDSKGVFSIESLAGIIERLTGKVGVWVFSLGFIAAALSSMLTCPLGASMTADSCFTLIKRPTASNEATYTKINSFKKDTGSSESDEHEVAVVSPKDKPDEEVNVIREFSKRYVHGINLLMILIATVTISANANRINVILVAQVFNGCLLPFFSICLLICINEPQFMEAAQQRGWANCALIGAVTVTLFLTCNTLIQNIFGWTTSNNHITADRFAIVKFSLSGCLSILVLFLMLVCTSLGKNVYNSLRR